MTNNLQILIAFMVTVLAVPTMSSCLHAQMPSIERMINDVDQAAAEQGQPKSRFGFKKIKMPKPFEGLVDLKLKKPTLPKFGFIEKLKSLGKPSFDNEPTTKEPLFAGLGKIFSPRPKTTPGFFDRIFNRQSSLADSENLLSEADMNELNGIARGLQTQAKRMSREAKSSMQDLFAPSNSPQPPYRSARQYQDSTSRY